MKHSHRLSIIAVASFSILLIVLAAYYSDFLGARFIRKGSPRLSVRQGEPTILELAPSPYTRKLEICTEKRNIILGRSDFVECRALINFVEPGVTEAGVIIPANMPLGRAIVITRIRDIDGTLIPAAPADEKITLWIAPPRGLAATTTGSGGSRAVSFTDTFRQIVGGGSSTPGTGSSGGNTQPTAGRAPSPSPSRSPSPSPSRTPTPTPTPASFRYCNLRESSSGKRLDLKWNYVNITPTILRSGSPVDIRGEMQNIGTADFPSSYLRVRYDKYNDDYLNDGKNDDTQTDRQGQFYEVDQFIQIPGLTPGAKRLFTHTVRNTTVTSLKRHTLSLELNHGYVDKNGNWNWATHVDESNTDDNYADCGFEIYP